MRRLFIETSALAELEAFSFDQDDAFSETGLVEVTNLNFDDETATSNYIPIDIPPPTSDITVTVSNSNSSGAGSFAQAVIDANASPGPDDIMFDLALLGTTIDLFSTVEIMDSLTIDFDIDGDDAGDVALLLQEDTQFFDLANNSTTLVFGRGDIVYLSDAAIAGDTDNVFSVTGDDITIDNSANILTLNFGPVGEDTTGVFNSTDFGDDFVLINREGASIVTSGRYGINALNNNEAISTTIVNDGIISAAEDGVRLNTGIIQNSGLIESTGEYSLTSRGPGGISDGIFITGRRVDSALPVSNGAAVIENTETGIIDGFRAGIIITGGGLIDNDGLITAEGTAIIADGAVDRSEFNVGLLLSDFTLINTGTITSGDSLFPPTVSEPVTLLIRDGLTDVLIENSGLIESSGLVIDAEGVGVTLNNLSGGEIISDFDLTGDDGIAFQGAVAEDFPVEARENFLFFDPFVQFESAQGITLDAEQSLVLPDGTVLLVDAFFFRTEAAFIADLVLIPLLDISETQNNGFIVHQTDENGTILYPDTIDIVSPTLGTLRVNFDAATGFTITDPSGNPVFDVPTDVNFTDLITNESGALIDGDVNTGLESDILSNAGEITGDVDLGRGDDTLIFLDTGSFGGDVDGGSDMDTLSFLGRTSRVVLTTDGVTFTVGGTDFVNFEAVEATDFNDVFTSTGPVGVEFFGAGGTDRLTGGSGDDRLFGEDSNDSLFGNAGLDVLDGGDGNDILRGGDDADILTGGQGADRLFGEAGDDTLEGGIDNDIVVGGDGNDTLYGDAGGDIVFGEAGEDILNGGDGNDLVRGGEGNDTLNGDAGNDTLLGDDGADIITGGAGTDVLRGGNDGDNLRGGTGDDRLLGEAGNDLLGGDAGADLLLGGLGNDSLFGASGADTLFGEAGNDSLNGGNEGDLLRGGDGADTLNGDAGDDRLFGDAGDDILSGGTGSDVMTGGAGADSFAYTLGSGVDAITDFGFGADTIFVDADLGVLGFADLQILQRGANTLIRLEPGGADTLILFNTVAADLTADDFVFEDPTALTLAEDDIFLDFATETASDAAVTAPVTAPVPVLYPELFDVEALDAVLDAPLDSQYDIA